MKKNLSLRGRSLWVTLLLVLGFVVQGFSQGHITMSLTNCAATGNSLSFDIMVVNDGTLPLNFNSTTCRMTHAAGIVPAGTNTFTFAYVAGTSDFSAAAATFSTAYTVSSRLMQLTSSPAAYTAPVSANDMPIGVAKRIGRFTLTITNTSFVAGQATSTAWSGTTSGVTLYANLATTTTAYNTTTTRTLGTTCSSNIPTPCVPPVLTASTTPTSCSNLNNGAINVSLQSGDAPTSYLWSNGATTEDLTGLAAGDYTVTATAGAGCVSLPYTFTVGAGPAATQFYADVDGDTYGGASLGFFCTPPVGSVATSTDCDDNNAATNPGATEVCNLVDDNCNGQIDEGALLTFYRDADNDTYGTPAITVTGCSAPTGFVSNNTDCNDASAAINPGATEVCNGIDDNCNVSIDEGLTLVQYFSDNDGDTYGGASLGSFCAVPTTGNPVTVGGDCNDGVATINPGAAEVCNGIDDDCDLTIDNGLTFINYYTDADHDGYGTGVPQSLCSNPGTGFSIQTGDCDDARALTNPGAAETCNGIDDDCDNQIDDGLTFISYFVDGDGDGYGAGTAQSLCSNPGAGFSTLSGDCQDGNAAVNPGVAEVCNGVDDNCDGSIDNGLTFVSYFVDADHDGYGTGAPQLLCSNPGVGFSTQAGDCDDARALTNPGAADTCNGIDDDCDNQIDDGLPFTTYYADGDNDGFGAPGGQSLCYNPGAGFVLTNGDCNDANPAVNPLASEVCNGIDDDCDGLTDDADASVSGTTAWYTDGDGDTYGAGAAIFACVAPVGSVASNTDCNDASAAVNPGAQEVCNGGIDDDCDGAADDADASTLASSKLSWYPDADGDTFGSSSASAVLACVAPVGHVASNTDCNDAVSSVNPAAQEVCNGGIDDDCDGAADDADASTLASSKLSWYPDTDGDTYGSSSASAVLACVAPSGHVADNSDCDDARATAFPGAPEQCNGLDDNCDGLIDNGVVFSNWFRDADGDAYGDAADVVSACAQPVGRVLNSTDCNDALASVNPGATEVCNGVDDNCNGSIDEGVQTAFFADVDNDGYGAGTAVMACTAPSGFVSQFGDCNDGNPAVNPGAQEVCNGGIDDDCDGAADDADASTLASSKLSWYPDTDGDTYGSSSASAVLACVAPSGHVASNTDCNDGDAGIHPGVAEVCNGIDDNCNGSIDEGLTTYTYYADADGDTYGFAGSPLVSCYTTAPSGYVTNALDCNDGNDGVNPAAVEVCGDGLDNNCDGTIDEGCSCSNPATVSAGVDQSICAGQNASLVGSFGGSTSTVTWTTSSLTGTFASASSAITTYYPSSADVAAGSVTLTLTSDDPDGSGPCQAATSSILLTINPLPTAAGAISGPATLCNPSTSSTTTYSIAAVPGASSYLWTVPAGTTIVSGQGTTALTVSWPFASVHNGVKGDICVTAQNSNSCGSATQSCLNISIQLQIPQAPNSVSGPAKACPGDVAQYSVAPVSRADYYVWTLPAGASITSPTSNTNIITVSYGPSFTGGTLAVRAVNGCGPSTDRVRTVGLNILSAPASITGPVSGVCGASGVIYTASAVTGASSYAWTVPAGAVIVGPSNGASISVDFGPSFTTSGNVTCTAMNNCGLGATRSVSVKAAPATPGVISGPLSVCAGSSNVYSVGTVDGATSYVWTVPSGAVITGGIGTKIVTVKFGTTPASSQAISVRATNGCGTSSSRTLSGIAITTCPRLGDGTSMELTAFPNPANEVLNITFSSDVVANANLRLVDLTGRVVYNEAKEVVEGYNTSVIRVKGLASGIYTLQLQLKDRTEQLRIFVD